MSDIIAEKMETAAIRNLTFPIKVKARKRGRGLNRVVEGRKEFGAHLRQLPAVWHQGIPPLLCALVCEFGKWAQYC